MKNQVGCKGWWRGESKGGEVEREGGEGED